MTHRLRRARGVSGKFSTLRARAGKSNLPPLDLPEIVRELTPAHEACCQAHAELCALADEQWQHLRSLLGRSGPQE